MNKFPLTESFHLLIEQVSIRNILHERKKFIIHMHKSLQINSTSKEDLEVNSGNHRIIYPGWKYLTTLMYTDLCMSRYFYLSINTGIGNLTSFPNIALYSCVESTDYNLKIYGVPTWFYSCFPFIFYRETENSQICLYIKILMHTII